MLYSISLFLHITGVLLLFSAVGIEWLCFVNMRRSESKETICNWFNQTKILKRLFPTASTLILLTGIYMSIAVWKDAGWVIIGFIGLIAIAVSGGVISGKKIAAIETIANNDKDKPFKDIKDMVNDNFLWNSLMIRTAAGLGIVYIMTIKTDLVNSIIVMVIAVIAGYVFAKTVESTKGVEKAEMGEA
jgi:hypothetical protein